MLEGDKHGKICITEPEADFPMPARWGARAPTSAVMDVHNQRQKKHWFTGAGVSRLHLIFARVFDERGEELEDRQLFLAVREQSKGLRVSKREQTMGAAGDA